MTWFAAEAVVFDNGTYHTRAGYAGDDFPSYINENIACGKNDHDQRPIQNGILIKLDKMEEIWSTCLDAIDIDIDDRSMLLNQLPLIKPKLRE